MRDEKKERFPRYVPLYYRAFVKFRKVYRQAALRHAEKSARKNGSSHLVPDGMGRWTSSNGFRPNPAGAANKSAVWIDEDMARPEIKKIVDGIESVKRALHAQGLLFTNTAATFLPRMFYPRSEYDKLWENAWTIHHTGVKAGHRVLDIGGASTPFSFYLASLGCSVAVVDNDWGNCGTLYNARYVAKKMGWDLTVFDRDVAKRLPFANESFDRVFSICTIEHLTSSTRRMMMKEIGRVLKPGGMLGLTMGYSHDFENPLVDKGLRFGYRDKLEADAIRPSGLEIYGNADLTDFEKEKNFLGALFLRKTS